MSLEDAGFCKKGEIGPFFDSVNTTYKRASCQYRRWPDLRWPAGGRGGGFEHVIGRSARSWAGLESARLPSTLGFVNG